MFVTCVTPGSMIDELPAVSSTRRISGSKALTSPKLSEPSLYPPRRRHMEQTDHQQVTSTTGVELMIES